MSVLSTSRYEIALYFAKKEKFNWYKARESSFKDYSAYVGREIMLSEISDIEQNLQRIFDREVERLSSLKEEAYRRIRGDSL
ncbi:hypothetical protein [Marinomonas pollencensis]|uniref:Uncharacterized protein n=1 Tax=Marinomonas pollencensis TaxID=491954 RepID=A0A3E0DS45_9GAMM|nr:hypothetical protein [Marinomonas pollencensis]REG85844.1 hypothetical protein DFP81_102383 [Marinomonas pollencensis]